MHDEDNCCFYYKDSCIKLGKIESKILSAIISHKNSYVSFQDLYNAIYDYEYDKYLANCVRAAITRLRKKMKDVIEIKNKKGKGYCIIYKYKSEGIDYTTLILEQLEEKKNREKLIMEKLKELLKLLEQGGTNENT